MKEIKWTLAQSEKGRLLGALQRNCDCKFEGGKRLNCCSSHAMLTDQLSVDRLQYGRFLRETLEEEENRK